MWGGERAKKIFKKTPNNLLEEYIHKNEKSFHLFFSQLNQRDHHSPLLLETGFLE